MTDIFKINDEIAIKKFNFVDSHCENSMTDKNGFKGKSGSGNTKIKNLHEMILLTRVELSRLQNLKKLSTALFYLEIC